MDNASEGTHITRILFIYQQLPPSQWDV